MGGSLSCFGSGGGGGRYYAVADEPAGYEQPRRSSRKVRPSDEDAWYVGERDVDMKASAYIARFHAAATGTAST